jgi:hypothetical protein
MVRSLGSHPKAVPWVLGKPFYVITGPQAGPLHALLADKEGRINFNIICLKLYQFKMITWWCLSLPESILESVMESTLQFVLKSILLENIKEAIFYRNLRQAHLLEVK